MKILVNGRDDIVSTENDVTMAELFQYLQQEFMAQRLLVRTFVLDGDAYFPDDTQEVHEKTPADFETLEVEVASFEVVGFDIMAELSDKAPMLTDEAVKVTEELQSGKVSEAQERMQKFINTAHYIVQAISNVSSLTGINVKDLTEGSDIDQKMVSLGDHLKEVEQAFQQKDFATIGDIMEFDIAPLVEPMVSLMSKLKDAIHEKIESEQTAESAESAPESEG